jgi:ribosomal protein S6--L-glutamate ligase
MKIAILSQDASLYSTHRLKEAGEERGHEMRVINYVRCYMNITSHKPMVIYQGNPLENFDAVIPVSRHQRRSTVQRLCGSLK